MMLGAELTGRNRAARKSTLRRGQGLDLDIGRDRCPATSPRPDPVHHQIDLHREEDAGIFMALQEDA
jgi:hypothetical protein